MNAASSGLTGCNDPEIDFLATTDAFSLILAVSDGAILFLATNDAESAPDPPVPEFNAVLLRLLELSLMSHTAPKESSWLSRSLSELTLNSDLR